MRQVLGGVCMVQACVRERVYVCGVMRMHCSLSEICTRSRLQLIPCPG